MEEVCVITQISVHCLANHHHIYKIKVVMFNEYIPSEMVKIWPVLSTIHQLVDTIATSHLQALTLLPLIIAVPRNQVN